MVAMVIISTIFFAALLLLSNNKFFTNEKPLLHIKLYLCVVLISGLFLRMFLSINTEGFAVDMGTFKAWGSLVCDVGFANTYSQGVFLDYPPGYLYVLALLENIRRALSLSFEAPAFIVLCKLPSIVADIACAGMLFAFAKNKAGGRVALMLCTVYLFCPTVLLNSAVWGQIDSVCLLLLITALLLLHKAKAGASGAVYALAVLCKPQMLIFAPVFLLWPINHKYKMLLSGVLCAVGTMIIVALPFGINQEPFWLFKLYSSTIASYNCYSVNAYNMWAFVGQNWVSLPNGLLGLTISLIAILISVAFCAILLYKGKMLQGSLFLGSAAIMSVLYLFGVKMHERYIFPVLLCLLLACAIFKENRLLRSFGALAAANALNVAHVLYLFTKQNGNYDPNSVAVKILSTLQIFALIYTIYCITAVAFPKLVVWQTKIKFKKLKSANQLQKKFKYTDFIILSVIVIIYSFTAFWRLGSHEMAVSSWVPKQGESVTFAAQQPASLLSYLPGISANNNGLYSKVGTNVLIQASTDGKAWNNIEQPQDEKAEVFTWQEILLPQNTYFVRLSASDENVVINEICLHGNKNKNILPVEIVNGYGAALIDEQSVVPKYRTYENSMYFDEIYHARTAYEHLQGLLPYENTHPPLGKLIIAIGIKLFGMNPFGWRFMGTLCGVLMLPVFYHLIKQLLGGTLYCSVATFLFAFDFMHFTQTRIATIDTFAVLFILLMYDAMIAFFRYDLQATALKKLLLPLFMSGVFMGLGIASKWTVAYGAAGLAILFFAKLFITMRKLESKKLRVKIMHRCGLLCAFCILFFCIIPFVIYFAAFLPITLSAYNKSNVWEAFWQYQINMFEYHAQLTAQHPYSSPWYEWPLSLRPLWYYVSNPANADDQYSTIAALGSPFLWWPCAVAMLYAAWRAIAYKCKASAIAVIGFLSAYLPWIFVPRSMFIYHYFPSIPFLILALIIAVNQIMQISIMKRQIIMVKGATVTIGVLALLGFVLLNIIMFALFFPVLSGMAVLFETVEALRWLPRWYF